LSSTSSPPPPPTRTREEARTKRRKTEGGLALFRGGRKKTPWGEGYSQMGSGERREENKEVGGAVNCECPLESRQPMRMEYLWCDEEGGGAKQRKKKKISVGLRSILSHLLSCCRCV